MTSIPQDENNLFDDSACDIAAVPVVDFDFVPSDIVCAPSPTPAAIFSCVAPIILPEPPTDVGVECPIFSAVSTIAVGYSSAADGADCDVVTDPDATLRIRRTSVDPCNYELDLNISVPIPRPPCETVLKAGTFNTNIGFAECVTPQSTIQINKNTIPGTCDTPDQCEFTIDLDIGIPIPRTPCPVINVNEFLTEVGYGDCVSGENRFTIVTRHRPPEDCNDPGDCEFDVDLQISVPIPEPPCPTLNVANFAASAGFTNAGTAGANCPQSKFEITATKTPGTCSTPSQCDFDLNLEVFVPVPRIPCPQIDVTAVSVRSGYERCIENPENRFTITSRHTAPTSCQDTGQCAFDVELALAIPIPEIPCPTISIDDFQVVAAFADSEALAAGNRFEITTRHQPPTGCNDPGTCDFGVALAISVPIPRPICPIIFVKEFEVKTSIACPTEPSVFKIETKVSNENEPDQFPICEFETTLKLNIPIPEIPCPQINIGTFVVSSGFAGADCVTNDNRFEIIKREIPGTCNTPKSCEFDLNLEVAVPIPRIKCPELKVGTFNVTSGFAGADCVGQSKFEIEKIIIAAEDCNVAETCEFIIDLDIAIPIPAPKCPTIRSTSQFTLRGSNEETQARINRVLFNVLAVPAPAGNCNEAPECSYNIVFDLDLLIPNVCTPKVIVDPVTVSTGYDLPTYFRITYTNEPRPTCLTTLGFDLSIGIRRPPCTIGSGQVNLFNLPATSPPFANMTVINTGEPGEFCSFEIILNLGLPAVCPVTFLDPLTNVFEAGDMEMLSIVNFKIVPILVTICPTFLPILELRVPRPCKPFFYRGNVRGYWIENWHANDIVIDFDITEQARCEYRYDLLVGIPKKATRVVRGEIRAQYTVCEAGEPDLFVEITPPDASGVQQLNVTLIIPKPPTYVAKEWTVESSSGGILGSVVLDIDPTGCERGIGGRIILNAVACPTTGGGTSAFTQLPTLSIQSENDADALFSSAAVIDEQVPPTNTTYLEQPTEFAAPDDKILDVVVRNLQLDETTNKPVNPAFYEKMRQFFKQIQNGAENE